MYLTHCGRSSKDCICWRPSAAPWHSISQVRESERGTKHILSSGALVIFSMTSPATCHGPIPEGRVLWPHYTLQVPPLHNSALGSTLLQALLQTTAARLMSHNFVWQSFNLFLNHDCSWMELPMAPSAMALDVVVTENLGPAQGCEHRMLLMCGFPAASFSIQTCCSLSCRSGQAKQCQQCYLRQLTQIWGSHMLGIGVLVWSHKVFFCFCQNILF